MKNISLVKVTMVVILAALASFIVSANNTVSMPQLEQTVSATQALVNAIDSDGDGLLSLAEITESAEQQLIEKFSKIDKNNDGLLSVAELEPFLQQIRPQGH